MKALTRILAFFAGVAATLAAYSIFVEPRWLQLRREMVHVRNLHPDLEGLRIGLLTDMHAQQGRSLEVVREAARVVAAERPDLIALTGDFITEELGTFEDVVDALSGLSAPLGMFAVPGNHDHLAGIEGWRKVVSESGNIEDLTNRSVVLSVGQARLCLTGVDDLEQGHPSLGSLPPPDERDMTVLLAHNPDQAERSRREFDNIDLIVSGHTHAGQIRIPGLGPIKSVGRERDLFEEGLKRRPWTQVYTSRGLGTIHLPMRFMARPEVTVIELTGAPREVWG